MKEVTEQQYKAVHAKIKMSIVSAFTDPDGVMPFGYGCPAMDTEWGIDGKVLVRCEGRRSDRHQLEWVNTYYLDESLFEQPKIDLSEIARIAQDLRGQESVSTSFPNLGNIEIESEQAKAIATALEALPKMHEALQKLFNFNMEVDSEGEKLASITEIVETYKLASETLQQFEQ